LLGLPAGDLDEGLPLDAEKGGWHLLVSMNVDEPHRPAHARAKGREAWGRQSKVGMGYSLQQGINDSFYRESVGVSGTALHEGSKPLNWTGNTGPLVAPTGLKMDSSAGISQGRLTASDAIRQPLRKSWQHKNLRKITPLLRPRFRGDSALKLLVERLNVRSGDGW
jgi:hypothetical protein